MIGSMLYSYSGLAGSRRETDPLGGFIVLVLALVPLFCSLASFIAYRAIDVTANSSLSILPPKQ